MGRKTRRRALVCPRAPRTTALRSSERKQQRRGRGRQRQRQSQCCSRPRSRKSQQRHLPAGWYLLSAALRPRTQARPMAECPPSGWPSAWRRAQPPLLPLPSRRTRRAALMPCRSACCLTWPLESCNVSSPDEGKRQRHGDRPDATRCLALIRHPRSYLPAEHSALRNELDKADRRDKAKIKTLEAMTDAWHQQGRRLKWLRKEGPCCCISLVRAFSGQTCDRRALYCFLNSKFHPQASGLSRRTHSKIWTAQPWLYFKLSAVATSFG